MLLSALSTAALTCLFSSNFLLKRSCNNLLLYKTFSPALATLITLICCARPSIFWFISSMSASEKSDCFFCSAKDSLSSLTKISSI